MAETQLCGLCTNVEEETTFEAKIFDPNQPQLLWQIEKLIGKRVLHICIICEEQKQTQQNFATQIKKKPKFSEVQPLPTEELASNEIHLIKEEQENVNKEDSGVLPSTLPLWSQIILKDEPLSPGGNFNAEYHDEPLLKEELASKEIHRIKEEQENDNKEDGGVLPSELPLLAQIILKDEPLSPGDNFNKEYHYDSDNSYNPFDVDQRNSMVRREESTEADGLTLEEMNEASLPSYSEVKPPIKAILNKSNISKREKRRQQNSIDSNCELCGKHFTLRSSLLVHTKRHTIEKRFKCDICPASSFTINDLKRHKLRHTWEFGCGHCDRRFKQKNDLTHHERIHTEELPYVCPTCGKGFFSSRNRLRHMEVHKEVRDQRCETCDVAFKRRRNLLCHFRSKKHKENVEKAPFNMTN